MRELIANISLILYFLVLIPTPFLTCTPGRCLVVFLFLCVFSLGVIITQNIKLRLLGMLLFLIALSLAAVFTSQLMPHSFYMTVSDLKNKRSSLKEVKISSKVRTGTINYSSDNLILTFDIYDEAGSPDNVIHVVYKGIKPDSVKDDKSVLIEGKYDQDENTLNAIKLLVKIDIPGGNCYRYQGK